MYGAEVHRHLNSDSLSKLTQTGSTILFCVIIIKHVCPPELTSTSTTDNGSSGLWLVGRNRQSVVSTLPHLRGTFYHRDTRRLCSLSGVLVSFTDVGPSTDLIIFHSRDRQWLASGSFDRTIKLWDPTRTLQEPLATLHAPETSGPKASVYALTTDPFGSIVAAGSPERVVRMWDPRSGKRVGKLVGHTDNIRAILISEDARYVSGVSYTNARDNSSIVLSASYGICRWSVSIVYLQPHSVI